MINKDIYQALQQLIPNRKIKVNESLRRYTCARTGSNIDFYITPAKNEEVQVVVKYAYQNEVPVTYLGNDSDIIIREGGIRGTIINSLSLDHIEVSDDAVIADNGVAVIDVSRVARDYALIGFKLACGIPGSTGSAVYMNAGVYGGEARDYTGYALCVNE